jgi:HPt (histidine-containing phosphotransfer) domain-containing protein
VQPKAESPAQTCKFFRFGRRDAAEVGIYSPGSGNAGRLEGPFRAALPRLSGWARKLPPNRGCGRLELEEIMGGSGGATADAGSAASVIDVDHLRRMTLGDRQLEREVLELFARQATHLLERIRNGGPDAAAMAAHTLKGSAHGIGAWRVARAAERLERAARNGAERDIEAAFPELDAATVEAAAAIGARSGRSFSGE